MSVNSATVSGNLTDNPTIRNTAKGTPVLCFSVCFDSRTTNADGTYENKPNYIDCALFGKRAEAIAPYLQKGSHVTVQGELSFSTYKKSNQTHSKLSLIISEIDFKTNLKKSA